MNPVDLERLHAAAQLRAHQLRRQAAQRFWAALARRLAQLIPLRG